MPRSPRYTSDCEARTVPLAKTVLPIPKSAADLGIATDSLRARIMQAGLDAGDEHPRSIHRPVNRRSSPPVVIVCVSALSASRRGDRMEAKACLHEDTGRQA
jgi:hypothetical protein